MAGEYNTAFALSMYFSVLNNKRSALKIIN